MEKWYYWLVLALIFALGGIINYFDDRNITASIIQVSITTVLAFLQLYLDKKGEKGKKIFNLIAVILTILISIWLIYLIVGMFIK